MTENGLIRILSNPAYPGRRTDVGDCLDRLRAFRDSGDHTFWPDSVSLSEEGLVRTEHVQGYRQLTDIYLLALVVKKGGRLATLDGGITPSLIAGAGSEHVALILPRDV